jgi:general secretion pathway protein G
MNIAGGTQLTWWRKGFSPSAQTVAVAFVAVTAVLLSATFLRPFRRETSATSDKVRVADVQMANLEMGLDYFREKSGQYPTTAEGLHVLIDPSDLSETYMELCLEKIRHDPWGHEYQYASPGKHNVDSYDLSSLGPDGKPGTADDITNWEKPRAER